MHKYQSYLRLKRNVEKKNKSRKVLFFLPFLLIIGLFSLNQAVKKQEEARRIKDYNQIESRIKDWIKTVSKELDESGYSQSMKKSMLENEQEQLSALTILQGNNFMEKLKLENAFFFEYSKAVNYMEESERDNFFKKYGFYEMDYMAGRTVSNQALIQKKMRPDSIRYGTNTATFLVSVSLYLTSFFAGLYFFLLFGFQSIKEREQKKYHTLGVQPLDRKRIFFLDYFVFIVQSLCYYLLLLAWSFIISAVFGSISSWGYPLIEYSSKTHLYGLLPVWLYLLIISLLFFLQLSVIYLLIHWLFSYMRKSFVSLLVVGGFLSLMFFGATVKPPESIKVFVAFQPVAYLNPSQLFIGNSYEKMIDIYAINPSEPYSDLSARIYLENVDYYLGDNLVKKTNNSHLHYGKGLFSLILVNSCLLLAVSQIFKKRMCS